MSMKALTCVLTYMYEQLLLCSQQPACPGSSDRTGFDIFGLYIYNKVKKKKTLHTTFSSMLHAMNLQLIDFQVFFFLQALEVNIVDFVRHELKRHKAILSSHSLERLGEDEQMVDNGSKEAFLKILLHFLKIKNNEELANCLQSSKDFCKWLT